jgi:hypothetical protein
MNITKSLDSQGNLVSINIELTETSGPVSPEYQYNLDLHLKNEGNGLLLKYSYVGKFIYGEPEKKIIFEDVIPKDKSIQLIDRLLELKPLGINIDLSENVKNNVGISFNELSLQIGENGKTKINYTLSDLDQPEFVNQSRIIQCIKKLENWKEA